MPLSPAMKLFMQSQTSLAIEFGASGTSNAAVTQSSSNCRPVPA